MKIQIYDVFFENESIWVSYTVIPDSGDEFEKIKKWVEWDKVNSDLITDYVNHKNYVVILQEHASNEVTYKEMLSQITDFHSWFDNFLNPYDDSDYF